MTDKELTNVSEQGQVQDVEASAYRPARTYRPAVDVHETPEAVTLLVDLPRVHPDDVRVQLENGVLTLTASTRPPAEERSHLLSEFEARDYRRCFRVSDVIDGNAISAELEHGVLTLRLPKVASVQPRRIEVRAG